MQLSLMTYTVSASWPGGCRTLEAMADLAAELGLAGLEVSVGDLRGRPLAEVGAICRDRNLAVTCINGPCVMTAEDDGAFREGMAAGKRLVEMAHELDCKVIMPLPGLAADEADKPRAAERITEGLREVVGAGQEAGVTVTLEDFPNRLAINDSIAGMQWLFARVPGLGLTYDNGNWMLAGDDPLAALDALSPYVANVHLKDWEITSEGMGLPMADGRWVRGGRHGQGLIDHAAVLGALERNGYRGYMAFEYEGPHDHTAATRDGIAYLREVLARVQAGSNHTAFGE